MLGSAAGMPRSETIGSIAIVYVPAVIVLNSRVGRDAEEIVTDAAVRIWRQLFLDVIPGVFRLILSTFDRVLEAVDRRALRGGRMAAVPRRPAPRTLVAKAVLGLGWFCIAYLVRVSVNVLIEPQVNPIKHFPVVTVSHKVILPLSFPLTRLLEGDAAGAAVCPVHRGHDRAPGAGRVRLPRLGAEGELAALRGEPLREPPAGDRRRPRRDHGPAAPAGDSLGHPAQAVRQAPQGRAPGARTMPTRRGRSSGSRRCTTSRNRFADSSSVTSSPCSTRAGRSVTRRSRRARSTSPPTGSGSSCSPAAPLRSTSAAEGGPLDRSGPAPGRPDRCHRGTRLAPRPLGRQTRVLTVALIGFFQMCGVDWVRVLPDPQAHSGGSLAELATVPSPGRAGSGGRSGRTVHPRATWSSSRRRAARRRRPSPSTRSPPSS